jgi:hypothetical protein
MNRRLDGPQNCLGQFGEMKNLLPLAESTSKFLKHPAHSVDTILNELSWLPTVTTNSH